jgi:CheY-like chemotaxis protein
MSSVLILEDREVRIIIFKKLLANHQCYFFDNVEDAIQHIKTYGMNDIMFLDHDLDDRVYVPSEEENTGYQFAKFLAENSYHCKKIVIHSQNAVGAENMYHALENVSKELYVIPFPQLADMIEA